MTESMYTRSEILWGKEGMERICSSHVAVFGLGGVGSFSVEAIARGGVGEITIVDFDTVSVTNRNRQLMALSSNIGEAKTAVWEKRLKDICPSILIHTVNERFTGESRIDFSRFDYVIDAIDDVAGKLTLMERCEEAGVPIVSSMGSANRLDPTAFQWMRLSKTAYDPLAKRLRIEARKRGLKDIWVVCSTEKPVETENHRLGSVSFVPSVVGEILAGKVLNELAKEKV